MFNSNKYLGDAFDGLPARRGRIALTAALTLSALTCGGAWAQPGCDLQTLDGSYLFSAQGWNVVDGVAQPKAIIEGMDFHGDGTLVTPFAVISVNGTIIRSGETAGTYTVNPDCTGAISFPTGLAFDFFTTRGGKKIWLIQTAGTPAAVFQGTATRLR